MAETASKIKRIAIIGAGVMGGGIAAQMADAGVEVILLDLVPEGAANRNALAEAAVKTQRESAPPGFVFPSRAGLITCGNLEDDLAKLSDCDWIIEAVKEDVRIKQDVYRKIEANRKSGSIVSSNTSTLPLRTLVSGMPESFTRDFMITHFFNPPRFTQLLEVVQSDAMHPGEADDIRSFADVSLGKTVLECKDTPGFIANRIGGYWMMRGLEEAVRQGVPVEKADAAMGPTGWLSQDRHLWAFRQGRHRPDDAYRVHHHGIAGASRRTTRSASSTPRKRWRSWPHDRAGLSRTKGQWRVLPAESRRWPENQGSQGPWHRRIPSGAAAGGPDRTLDRERRSSRHW